MNAEKKSMVMQSSCSDKTVIISKKYERLPDGVKKNLAGLLSGLSEKTKGMVRLSVVDDSKTMIEAFAEDAEIPETPEIIGRALEENEELLNSVAKFHLLYFTEDGRKILESLRGGGE